jgi:hypothetical protein
MEDFSIDGPKTAISIAKKPANPTRYGIAADLARFISRTAETMAHTPIKIGASFAKMGAVGMLKSGKTAAIWATAMTKRRTMRSFRIGRVRGVELL